MDSLSRLIVALFLALMAGVSAHASGTVAVVTTSTPSYSAWGGTNCPTPSCAAFGTDPVAIATAYMQQAYPAAQGYSGWHAKVPANGIINATRYYTTWCVLYNSGQTESCSTNVDYGRTLTGTSNVNSCPSNASGNGPPITACTCNAGYIPDGAATACVPLPGPVCPPREVGETQIGPFTSSTNAWLSWQGCQAVAATATSSAGGCVHLYTPGRVSEGASGWWADVLQQVTGANCTPNGGTLTPVGGSGTAPPTPTQPASAPDPSDPKPTPSQNVCALGTGAAMCPATVNGASVCVPCTSGQSGGGAATPLPTPVSAGGGSVPTPDGGSVAVPIGGSALQGTTCTAGVCTTQTFIRDANGVVSNTVTTTQGQTDFCAKNPGNSVCIANHTGPNGTTGTGGTSGGGTGGNGSGGEGTASTFGGSCAAFSCSGDAIQCAMAKDQHVRHCQFFDTQTPESEAGHAAIALGDTKHAAGTHWRGDDTEVDIGVRATAAAVNPYAASCPADQVLTIGGAQIVIPMSSACTFLQSLGLIAVAVTVISCAGMLVSKGV